MRAGMYLTKIVVNGLFGIADVEWDLLADVNILGGRNGEGKSTILKATYELLHNREIVSRKLTETLSGVSLYFANGVELHWRREVKNIDNLHRRYAVKVPEGKKVSVRTCVMGSVFTVMPTGMEELPEQAVYFINSFEQIVANAEVLKVESALKDNEKTFLDVLIEKELNKRNGVYADVFAKILGSLNQRVRITEEDRKALDSYMALYGSVEQFMKHYKCSGSTTDMFLVRNGDVVPFTRMSMGEKQLLLLLLMAYNSCGETCIFLMDEPDLGMHIGWKEKLVRELHRINPDMQIILSTHSPSMIEGWYDNVREISQLTRKQF